MLLRRPADKRIPSPANKCVSLNLPLIVCLHMTGYCPPRSRYVSCPGGPPESSAPDI